MATANQFSIRERIMRELFRSLTKQVKGAPVSDPYEFEWDNVQRTPLDESSNTVKYAVALIEGDERKDGFAQMAAKRAVLDIEAEFWAMIGVDCSAAEEANKIIMNLERRLLSDIHVHENGATTDPLAQLAERLTTLGNSWRVDDEQDRTIRGSVIFEVQYKHREEDPRAII